MPKNIQLEVNDLKIDLKNYRTVPQKNEIEAINAMIAIKPDRFYAVVQSIIDDGYLPTENLIVLEDKDYTVKEGNRRTAALKLIHGIHSIDNFNIPNNLKKQIEKTDDSWKLENKKIPCSVYLLTERDKVDKIVNLTHAKGEKASRDPWTSVARARQNRNEKNGAEPALDLLEKYIEFGKNITNQQKERWSGDYPLTVLDEAIRVILSRLGYTNFSDLVDKYPKIKYRFELEDILRGIGLQAFGFKEIRSKSTDFAADYNIPSADSSDVSSSDAPKPSTQPDKKGATTTDKDGPIPSQKEPPKKRKPKAHPICDQRTVNKTLKKFNPKGDGRQKLVTLRDELRNLKIEKNPIAFCFILRSMFEISANIYSIENNISTTKKKKDKEYSLTLKSQLDAVTNHLTENNKNKGMVKALHGSYTELSKETGLLSITSLNQLVHNPSFSIAPNDIFTLFNNVYPLLEAMN